MTFVTALALAIALLVAIPYAAHRLRRQRAEERPFPAAHLVPPAPPRARRRSRLEDKALFGTRAAAIVALAVLGASPFVRCSRLSLHRSQGASVALAVVLDDSMSMRAAVGADTRFDRAKKAARELVDSAQQGDAIAIVLAGSPARVALPATTELGAAREALEQITQSDRGTDLEGALALAGSLVDKLPQVDRRVVVLSDLADGKPDGAPLGEGSDLPVWIPLDEIRGPLPDCALLSADREGGRVRARYACGKEGDGEGRALAVFAGPKGKEKQVGSATMSRARTGDVSIAVPPDAPDPLEVRLGGADAIASDDVAPVLVQAGPGALGVVSDTEGESAATGGAPVLEQALGALQIELALRPIPAVPDRVEDLAGFLGLVVDDPPGFTPEQRHTLASFAGGGGALLVALGPRAAAAPLGATLEPVLGHATTWGPSPAKGADAARALGALAEAADGLTELDPKGRTTLGRDDVLGVEVLAPWTDGAPLVARRALGPAGTADAWVVTLPFSLSASELPLRPGFLALLDAWVAQARAHASPRRADVGAPWTFPLGARVTVSGPLGAVPVTRDPGGLRAAPPVIGAYTVEVAGKSELRVAGPVAAEVDLRPRAAAKGATGGSVGGRQAPVDASPAVAVFLLALVAVELVLRLRTRPAPEAA